jgi:uncharacterized protein YndB with AHSA1/START domain
MTETVKLDVELNSPIERVWNALTDSETLSKWMMFKSNDFQPVVGHEFRFSGAQGFAGSIDCKVLEVEKPNRLSYSWVSDTLGPSGLHHSTVVTWTLTESEGGVTRLQLEQSGFQSGGKQEIGGAKYGWKHMLDALEGVLAAS